jgi:hypothetical protein
MGRLKARRSLVLALAFLALGPASGLCQEGASLVEVEAFMAQGRIMEARRTLETWWTAWFAGASRTDRQRGICLRGKLTVDPAMAELDFRRLVLEFPGGPFSDDALFRLGLSADLRGDLRVAQASFARLVRDYPASPRVPEAQRWIRLHAGEIAALPEERPPPTPEPVGDASSQGGQGEFAVQTGAFRSLARESARQLARELERLGFEVTLATDAGSEERVGSAWEAAPGTPIAPLPR